MLCLLGDDIEIIRFSSEEWLKKQAWFCVQRLDKRGKSGGKGGREWLKKQPWLCVHRLNKRGKSGGKAGKGRESGSRNKLGFVYIG